MSLLGKDEACRTGARPQADTPDNRAVPGRSTDGWRLNGRKSGAAIRETRRKSLKKIKDTLRRHTQCNQGRNWEQIVEGVNRSLRGWFEYYQHSVANVFAPLDSFVRRRRRSLLAKRRGWTMHGKGTAHQRWPNERLAR